MKYRAREKKCLDIQCSLFITAVSCSSCHRGYRPEFQSNARGNCAGYV